MQNDGKKDKMEEIDEGDEFIDEQNEMMLNKPLKEKKKHKLIGNERTNFHSGEYYKIKDLEKKLEEGGGLKQKELQLRAANQKAEEGHKEGVGTGLIQKELH